MLIPHYHSSLFARLRSHWRCYSIPADPPRTALQHSVGLFGCDDEDFCPRLEIGLVSRHVGDNGRIGGNKDFLFPVLVLQRQRWAVNRRDDLLNVRIGHRALGSKVPWLMSFAGSPHRFRKDVHFECGLAAVRPRHPRDTHERALLDVRQRGFSDAGKILQRSLKAFSCQRRQHDASANATLSSNRSRRPRRGSNPTESVANANRSNRRRTEPPRTRTGRDGIDGSARTDGNARTQND